MCLWQAGDQSSNSLEMKILLGPACVKSSLKVIEVSEKDFPLEIVNEQFDQVKITVRKSEDQLTTCGVSGISLRGFSEPKLCEAAQNDDVQSLLAGGADINLKDDKTQETAFTFASRNIDIMKLILDRPELKLGCTDKFGYSVLHDACFFNCPEMIPLICKDQRCTADLINKKNKLGNSCLMLAVEKGRIECLEELSKVKGVDWKTQKNDGESLMQVAKRSQNKEIMRILDEKLKQVATEERAEESGEMATTLVKVKTNIEEIKSDIVELKARKKERIEEFSRMQDEEIKIIKEKYRKQKKKFLESNKLEISAKEKDQTEHELLEREIMSKLLQSLSVPVPEEQVPECPACMEMMKPPLLIFNCPNGHLICSICKPQVPGNLCTECKTPYAGRANGMEKIVRRLMNLD